MSEMQQSMKIFTIIAQIERYLEESPKSKLGSGNRHVVDVDEVFDLLGDLKVTIPEDIRRANSVLVEADKIMDDAQENANELLAESERRADQMVQEAQQEAEQIREQAAQDYEKMVSESEVYSEAVRRADQLQERAEINANIVYSGAKKYADDVLQDLQRYLSEYHTLVGQNRKELGVEEAPEEVAVEEQYEEQYEEPVEEEPVPVKKKRSLFKPQVAEDEMKSEEEEEPETEEEAERPRGIKGWFRKHIIEYDEESEEDTDEEEPEEEEEAPAPRKRTWKEKLSKRAPVEMDTDLDE